MSRPAPKTCGACHGTGRTPWQGKPITCAWCLGGGQETETIMFTPNVQAGCMDCSVATSHETEAAAVAQIRAHAAVWPEHRPLIATAGDGWHRAWVTRHAPALRPLS